MKLRADCGVGVCRKTPPIIIDLFVQRPLILCTVVLVLEVYFCTVGINRVLRVPGFYLSIIQFLLFLRSKKGNKHEIIYIHFDA